MEGAVGDLEALPEADHCGVADLVEVLNHAPLDVSVVASGDSLERIAALNHVLFREGVLGQPAGREEDAVAQFVECQAGGGSVLF